VHTGVGIPVAIGTSASAFWILALNSWMQTPQGFKIIDGQLHAADWWAIIFNPSFPYRLVHMMIASGLTAAFLMAGISALQLLRRPKFEPAQRMLRVGIVIASVLTPVQIMVGDLHGLNTLRAPAARRLPPSKASGNRAWARRFCCSPMPNGKERHNDFAIAIPRGASLILTHELAANSRA